MSDFKVVISKVKNISPIEGADTIVAAQIEASDYVFVVTKDDFQVGDLVIYFPLDAILPQNILQRLGFWDAEKMKGTLSGPDGNRVKTKRLRGQISQGICAKPETILDGFQANKFKGFEHDFAADLGVVKYEEEPASIADNTTKGRKPLPGWLDKTDIENAQNYPFILGILRSHECTVTEKLEGSNFSILVKADGTYSLFSRNFELVEPSETNVWLLGAKNEKLVEKLSLLIREQNLSSICLRGELVGPGVQGNYYQLKEHRVYAFDLVTETGAYFYHTKAMELCRQYSIRTVPFIDGRYDWEKPIEELAHGPSAVNPGKLREGVVIRPHHEAMHAKIGRLWLKYRDPIYLAKSEL